MSELTTKIDTSIIWTPKQPVAELWEELENLQFCLDANEVRFKLTSLVDFSSLPITADDYNKRNNAPVIVAKTNTKHLPPNRGETKLEKHARCWLNDKSKAYGSNVESVLEDLFRNGCVSGMVNHLISYHDTNDFFLKHRAAISTLLSDALDDAGCSVSELFGDKWDNVDPLASEPCGTNRNLLAWFGFEEAARQAAYYANIEI